MQHLDEGTIHSWLDGALSADEAARVEAHVKECAQCQAAVAEARGFIAASSRILTALDNPPREVIPAAAPKKRIDPMVWRIAASVLVVALGSVLVIREQGTSEKSSIPRETIDSTCAPNCPAPALGPPVTVLANPKSSAPAQTPARRNGATATMATSPTDVGAASAAPSAPSVAGGNLGARQDLQKAPAAAPRATAQPAPDRRFEEAEGRAAGIVAADAAMADEQPLRVVGRPRALGEKLTFNGVAYTVVGKLRKKKQDSNYSGPDNDKIFVPFAAMMRDIWLQITAGQGPVECAWAVTKVIEQLHAEAMAAGLPIISTKWACIPEMVEDGVNGFLIEAGDTHALVEKLFVLLTDDLLRRKMGQASRQRYLMQFHFDIFARRLCALFAEALDSVQAKPSTPMRTRVGR